jgi:hypothetical protein
MQSDPTASTSNLAAHLLAALHHWHDVDSSEGLLADLLVFHQVAGVNVDPPRQTNDQLVRQLLSLLRRRHPADADLLELRYLDAWPVNLVANRLNIAESTVYTHQRRAITLLAAVTAEMERAAWRARTERIEARIDAPAYTELVGVEAQVEMLAALVAEPKAPWVVSIEGIGGIGKTVLADALVRQLSRSLVYEDFGWVSAQPLILDAYGAIRAKARPALSAAAFVTELLQQIMPEEAAGILARPEQAQALLRDRLKRVPHLVVVDNLETITDLEALLPLLRSLANPTKFVLTSRKRLAGEHGVYPYMVPELSAEYAFALMRHTARQHNIVDLLTATDAELEPLYVTVGGNPLALLLVAGQLHVQSLDSIVHALRDARGAPIENLYTFIYRRAWDGLDPLSRRVLLTMSLVNVRGDTLDFVTATADLPKGDVVNALQHLITLNLVNTTGDLHQRRYLIHSLTRSFLHEQVARWV